jgi:hypothetical protein
MISRTALLIVIAVLGGGACSQREDSQLSHELAHELAQCLTENGWIMYGSVLCSACRAQRELFGEAFEEIQEVECNPSVDGAQPELCLARNVRRVPTWIREQDGDAVDRVENLQLLNDLARLTGCSS